MSKSYNNQYARLAAAGVNILNLVPLSDKSVVLFEYSWRDPEQEGKLHWSKSMVTIYPDDNFIDDVILDRVTKAREELERGE